MKKASSNVLDFAKHSFCLNTLRCSGVNSFFSTIRFHLLYHCSHVDTLGAEREWRACEKWKRHRTRPPMRADGWYGLMRSGSAGRLAPPCGRNGIRPSRSDRVARGRSPSREAVARGRAASSRAAPSGASARTSSGRPSERTGGSRRVESRASASGTTHSRLCMVPPFAETRPNLRRDSAEPSPSLDGSVGEVQSNTQTLRKSLFRCAGWRGGADKETAFREISAAGTKRKECQTWQGK